MKQKAKFLLWTQKINNSRKLLSRDEFRESVFARDGHVCVFCKKPAKDAHHIIERRLFTEPHEFGGYFIHNGASVCEEHHLQCEMTLISVEDVREACGISKPIVPSHIYEDTRIDKWGNEILANGMRLRGELFHDESVQKILKAGAVLDQFTNRVKYPRSHHVPWSPGIHDDDRVMISTDRFIGQRVIVTEKMDGECTTFYNDYIHARSIDGRHHPSRDYVKGFWSSICHDIPHDWRVCGENLFAKHSIYYSNLSSYFMGFSIWNEKNVALSWDETKEWFDLLGIISCPVLYDGIYDENLIRNLYNEKTDWDTREGYVVRIADGFSYGEFRYCVGKYVRSRHVQTAPHNWVNRTDFVTNKLKKTY